MAAFSASVIAFLGLPSEVSLESESEVSVTSGSEDGKEMAVLDEVAVLDETVTSVTSGVASSDLVSGSAAGAAIGVGLGLAALQIKRIKFKITPVHSGRVY